MGNENIARERAHFSDTDQWRLLKRHDSPASHNNNGARKFSKIDPGWVGGGLWVVLPVFFSGSLPYLNTGRVAVATKLAKLCGCGDTGERRKVKI